MRLLKCGPGGEVSLTKDLVDDVPAYAILSHTWGADEDEVVFDDFEKRRVTSRVGGYRKLQFCARQAAQDGLQYFWMDTCCINKADNTELSEAIRSMFRWYRGAAKCYVYLSDVGADSSNESHIQQKRKMGIRKIRWFRRDKTSDVIRGDDMYIQPTWEAAFRESRWFTRGWTLQELLSPASVDFYSQEGKHLGNKKTLERLIHEITRILIAALRGEPLSQFSVDERLRWSAERRTKKVEDQAYCLLGIFDIFMPLMYGEGENAVQRLKDNILKRGMSKLGLHSFPLCLSRVRIDMCRFDCIICKRTLAGPSIPQPFLHGT